VCLWAPEAKVRLPDALARSVLKKKRVGGRCLLGGASGRTGHKGSDRQRGGVSPRYRNRGIGKRSHFPEARALQPRRRGGDYRAAIRGGGGGGCARIKKGKDAKGNGEISRVRISKQPVSGGSPPMAGIEGMIPVQSRKKKKSNVSVPTCADSGRPGQRKLENPRKRPSHEEVTPLFGGVYRKKVEKASFCSAMAESV